MIDILVADDTPSVRLLIRRVLEPTYRVSEAADGNQALEQIRATRPAVVLLDVSMPGRSGLDVCRQMRADPTLAAIRVIIFTANGGPLDEPAAYQAGADCFLTKPFSPLRIFQLVEALVRPAHHRE